MDIDPRILALVAIVVTVALWAAAILLGRVDGRVTARGFRNGSLIAFVLFALTALIVAFVFNGRAVFLVTLDLNGAIELGLLVGLVVGLGYLWLGSVLIAVGLIFRSKPQWTTLGAWAAVPVIVVAAGFGYTSYRSVASEGSSSKANGLISLNLSGQGTGRISADGAATCSTDSSGTLTVTAGTPTEPRIVTADGRLTSARIVASPDAGTKLDEFSIAGLELTPDRVTAAPASTTAAGQLQLEGSNWTGTISWSCNQ